MDRPALRAALGAFAGGWVGFAFAVDGGLSLPLGVLAGALVGAVALWRLGES